MLLNPKEQLIFSEQVETGSGATRHEGTLYLTDSRILFEGKVSQGTFGGAVPVTLMNVSLSSVSNVMVSAPVIGRALLQIETNKGAFSFRTKSAQIWSDQITGARSRAPPPPPPRLTRPQTPQPSSGQPIVIHLRQDNAQPAVFLHCRYCGTLNQSGTGRCTSCGAAL
jgi:hypothetical protein